MRNASLQAAYEAELRAEFNLLKAQRMYTVEYIIKKLAAKYFKTERAIQCVLYGQYDRDRARIQAQRAAAQGPGLFDQVA